MMNVIIINFVFSVWDGPGISLMISSSSSFCQYLALHCFCKYNTNSRMLYLRITNITTVHEGFIELIPNILTDTYVCQ